MNFIFYNENYDDYSGLPEWAMRTLEEHKNDLRDYLYDIEEFENGKTHDSYWNAAQLEMICTGKMHGYMRMYWGKKIIEWSRSPEEAFKTALYLNNKYELDGRDPNGFTGVAWCFGKHDRPWIERPIFGKVRYMNANGLKRKFNIEQYVTNVNRVRLKHEK
jgi:deoxyribodipyrimidine photo-lyase